LTIPICIVALAMQMVPTKSPILAFWYAKTCSMRDWIFDRQPLARAVVPLIDRPFGFFWRMSETKPLLSS
jgi:hypothetical protein